MASAGLNTEGPGFAQPLDILSDIYEPDSGVFKITPPTQGLK